MPSDDPVRAALREAETTMLFDAGARQKAAAAIAAFLRHIAPGYAVAPVGSRSMMMDDLAAAVERAAQDGGAG